MAHKGKRKWSKTSSIAVSQGWLICSTSCPSPSPCPKWLSHRQHLREDLQTPAPASIESFRPRAAELWKCSHGWIWSPPWHISPGALLFQVSAGAQALHFNQQTGKSLPQTVMGQMFVLAVRLAAWFLLHTHRFRRRWDRLWEGGCRLGGACQHLAAPFIVSSIPGVGLRSLQNPWCSAA